MNAKKHIPKLYTLFHRDAFRQAFVAALGGLLWLAYWCALLLSLAVFEGCASRVDYQALAQAQAQANLQALHSLCEGSRDCALKVMGMQTDIEIARIQANPSMRYGNASFSAGAWGGW